MSHDPSLVIIGGSNSLLRDGWVDQLKKLHPEPERVVKLSIGMATTAMGIYRLLACKDLPPDPVILWEYSLNESHYFEHRNPVRGLLYHTRWLFEICARRGYRVLPVLLYNKAEAEAEEPNTYRQILAKVLRRYRLKPLDARRFWQRKFPDMPVDALYKDHPHYSTETAFPKALTRMALRRAKDATVPEDSIPQRGFAGRDLRILTPPQAKSEPFANRIITCDTYPMTSPLRIPMNGRLLACFMLSSQDQTAINFRSGQTAKGPYSAQISGRDGGPPVLLKHLLLWNPKSPPLEADGELMILPQEMGDQRPVVQHTMAWRRKEPLDAAGGGLIGVLAEVDG
ncbi:hypothetical protein PAF17_18070 [Paracoccus sp. Z330]|uniref:SGNH hydrolase-type esterase domain-containing protein n=1 Tax=Paracoccus onchidii TaxID=3017813 RepID=A0ABT4ZJ58_9RHOB|nr:hypothetical protein [Paracoccus onchidii]MDB6179394.1 hypothetical protein [Paracoccus onchidii]